MKIPVDLLASFPDSPFLVEALARRGISTSEQARGFLDPNLYQPCDPFDLPGMDVAVSRVLKAIDQDELIAVWGDFDVDGQTSTAVLVHSIRQLGGRVVYHIPVRESESHGVNIPQLDLLIEKNASLLLTCDTGSSAYEAIQYAQSKEMDVLVTDHHLLPGKLPCAQALINPQFLPSNHPAAGLCGVGVAWKLSEALFKQRGRIPEMENVLDLVALGTVADVATLSGDNRYLVQLGLALMRSSPRRAIKAIMDIAGIQPQYLNENHLAFGIAPRLNAIGRLADANPVVDFLLTENDLQAYSFASQLELLNGQRKRMCDQVFQAAQTHIEQHPAILKESILVLDHPAWPASILGIVASRLVEVYSRPVILIAAPAGKVARGSARSMAGIDITAAITAQQDLLLEFGGHAMAAGLSLDSGNINTFRQAIDRYAAQTLDIQDEPKEVRIDFWLPLKTIDKDLSNTLELLAPYGAGNPPYTIASRNLIIKETLPFGRNKDHVSMVIEDQQGERRKALFWNMPDNVLPEGLFDLAYQVRTTNYLGNIEITLEWMASRPSERNIPLQASSSIEVIDLRGSEDPLKAIQPYLFRRDAVIWKEGDPASPPTGLDRYHLSPANCLVIWTLPPGLAELQSAIRVVQPHIVVIVTPPVPYSDLNAFLAQLGGLLKFALAHKKETSAQELAGLLAHTETTILQGIRWFQENGILDSSISPDGRIMLRPGTQSKSTQLSEVTSLLKAQIMETAAFRKHCCRTDLYHMIEKILTIEDGPQQ